MNPPMKPIEAPLGKGDDVSSKVNEVIDWKCTEAAHDNAALEMEDNYENE